MARAKKDTRKYHVVRVNGWTETVIKTFDDEVAAVKEMNRIGRKNQVGIIATGFKGSYKKH